MERGYCMMIGGDPKAVARLDPIFAALAPGVTNDYASVTSTTDSIAFGGVSENYKSLWFEGIDIGDESTVVVSLVGDGLDATIGKVDTVRSCKMCESLLEICCYFETSITTYHVH